MNISTFDKKGYEADDLIGTLSKKMKADRVVIVTGDKDQLQLVDEKTNVYMPVKGISKSKLLDKKGV